MNGTEFVGGIVGYLYDETFKITNCKWYSANSDIRFGIGSTHSNENATYVENLKLENVINIINEENKFKMAGEKVVLNWQ